MTNTLFLFFSCLAIKFGEGPIGEASFTHSPLRSTLVKTQNVSNYGVYRPQKQTANPIMNPIEKWPE